MDVVEQIRALTNHKSIDIPVSAIARYSGCNKSTLGKYLNGESSPTPRLEAMVREGLRKMYSEIKEIMEGE